MVSITGMVPVPYLTFWTWKIIQTIQCLLHLKTINWHTLTWVILTQNIIGHFLVTVSCFVFQIPDIVKAEFNIGSTNIILNLNEPLVDVTDSLACLLLCLVENSFSCHQAVFIQNSNHGSCYLGPTAAGQMLNVTEIADGRHFEVYLKNPEPIGIKKGKKCPKVKYINLSF